MDIKKDYQGLVKLITSGADQILDIRNYTLVDVTKWEMEVAIGVIDFQKNYRGTDQLNQYHQKICGIVKENATRLKRKFKEKGIKRVQNLAGYDLETEVGSLVEVE